MLRKQIRPSLPVPAAVRVPEPPLNTQQTALLTTLSCDLRSIQKAPRPVAVLIKT